MNNEELKEFGDHATSHIAAIISKEYEMTGLVVSFEDTGDDSYEVTGAVSQSGTHPRISTCVERGLYSNYIEAEWDGMADKLIKIINSNNPDRKFFHMRMTPVSVEEVWENHTPLPVSMPIYKFNTSISFVSFGEFPDVE